MRSIKTLEHVLSGNKRVHMTCGMTWAEMTAGPKDFTLRAKDPTGHLKNLGYSPCLECFPEGWPE